MKETTTYTLDRTQELAQIAVRQIRRNGHNLLRQCLTWDLLRTEMQPNEARDYWSDQEGKLRTDMPPEIDREIMATGKVAKVHQGLGSYYIYIG